MPTIINASQQDNPLGTALNSIAGNMFNNGAQIALRRAQVQQLQRENYGVADLANLMRNSKGGQIDPQQAASDAVLGNLGPEKVAGFNTYLASMNNDPRAPIVTQALNAEGKYNTSPANLDLDRANAMNIANNHNTTSITNTNAHVAGSEANAGTRAASQEKIAAIKNGFDQFKFANAPVPGMVNGQPGFVRRMDPALGAPIDPTQPNAIPQANAAPQGVVPKIAQAESGNNPTAANPNSSATGAGQFLDSTWMDTVSKHAPELLQGRTRDQVLALRNEPGLSDMMTAKYAQDNAGVLQSQGLPVTDGTKYLSHFLGPGGAVKTLKADPRTPMSQLVSPEALQANPMLASMTAGDAIGWATKKMGGSSQAAPANPSAPQPGPMAPTAPVVASAPAVAGAMPPAQPTAAPAAHTVTPIPKGPLVAQGMVMPGAVPMGADGKPDPVAQKTFLSKLSPVDRQMVLGLTDPVNPVDPATVPLQGGQRNRAISLAEAYNGGNFNASNAKNVAAFRKSETGDGRIGQAMTSLDTVLGHASGVGEAGNKMTDHGWSVLNHVSNMFLNNNDPSLAAYKMNLEPMGREAETYFAGKGMGSVEGAKSIIDSLSPDMTHEARTAALAQLGGMIKDRFISYANEHQQATGDLSSFPAPDIRPMMKKLGVDTTNLDPIYARMKGGGQNVRDLQMPGAPASAPAAAAAPAAAGKILKYDSQGNPVK